MQLFQKIWNKSMRYFILSLLLCISLCSVAAAQSLQSAEQDVNSMPLGLLLPQKTDSAGLCEIKNDYNRAYGTVLSVDMCAGSYSPSDAIELSYLRHYGWKIDSFNIKGKDGEKANFLVASAVTKSGVPFYVIAVRGSADKEDWRINFMTSQVPFSLTEKKNALQLDLEAVSNKEKKKVRKIIKKLPSVHKGFRLYADTVMDSVLTGEASKAFNGRNLLQAMKDPEAHVLLTGHSLGGAVAILLGEDLLEKGVSPERLHVITFGSPAVGNTAFAEKYGNRLDLLRVINTADPVPRSLQMVNRRYKQFGKTESFSLTGGLSVSQHPVAMYMDCTLQKYYALCDRMEEEKLLTPPPMIKNSCADCPKVAIWVENFKDFKKEGFIVDLRRFLLYEYMSFLPDYVILEGDSDLFDTLGKNPGLMFKEAENVGAEYVLTMSLGLSPMRDSGDYYITLEQSLWRVKDRSMLVINSIGKRTTNEMGNVAAAMEALAYSRKQLAKELPQAGIKN